MKATNGSIPNASLPLLQAELAIDEVREDLERLSPDEALIADEEGRRPVEALRSNVGEVGCNGRCVRSGVDAGVEGRRIKVERQTHGLEPISRERTLIFPILAAVQQVMELPEAGLVAGTSRGVRGFSRLTADPGEVVPDQAHLARIDVRRADLRFGESGKGSAGGALEVAVLVDHDRSRRLAEHRPHRRHCRSGRTTEAAAQGKDSRDGEERYHHERGQDKQARNVAGRPALGPRLTLGRTGRPIGRSAWRSR